MVSNLGNSASKSKKFHGEQESDAVGNLTRKLTQLKKQIQADRAVSVKANEMLHHHGNLAGYLAYFTGQSLEKIHQDTDHDYFMSPKEATEYGLIDGIISNPLKALQPLAAAADQQQ